MSRQHFIKRPAILSLITIIAIGLVSFIIWPQPEPVILTYKQPSPSTNGNYASTLSLSLSPDPAPEKSKQLAAFKHVQYRSG